MIDLKKAKEILHLDDDSNDEFVKALIVTLPDYIEITTGCPWNGCTHLADTLGAFLLQLWYYSDHADDRKLQRTIDNLTKALTLEARKYNVDK